MTQFGTAFVSIEPDFSSFDRLVTRKLAGSLAGAGEQGGRNFGDGFTKTFEQRSTGIGAPLDRAVADFNTKLRTKIETPKIPTPKLPDVDLSQSARLDLQIAGAEAEAEQLRKKIAELTAQPATKKVTADIGDAVRDLDRVEAKAAKLSKQRAEIKVDVDDSAVGTFARIGNAASGLLASLGGSGGGGGIGNAAARVSAGFVSFGATAGPLIAIMAALAATIGVALVGALAALASSAALAVAGLAALGAAAGGILGASLGLLIPVVIRMSKVFESLKADNTAADQAAQGAAAGAKAAAAAARAQETAARGLTEANRQLGVASKRAYQEMADAAEAASDAVRSVAQAKLTREQASLNTDKAVADLAELRAELGATGDAFNATFDKFTDVSVDTSGLQAALSKANEASGGEVDASGQIELRQKILDVRQARLSEKESINGVSDAMTTAQRAQARHNEFVKQGIAASESYRGALRGVESATLAVAAANEQAKAAQDVGATNAAQEKAALLAGRLTKAEVKLKETIGEVGKALRGAFTPATDAIITGLTVGLGRIPKLVNPLRGSIGRLGEAWQASIETFSHDLIRPDSIAKFKAFTDGAARLAGPITRGLSAFLDILTDIGVAALPYLVRGTERVADNMEKWAKGTGNAKALDKVIKNLVGHLKTWLGVGLAIGDVFLAFFVDAAGPGQALAETIKDLAKRTAAWLRSDEGRDKLAKFFRGVIPLAKQVASGIAQMVVFTFKFGQIAAPILSAVFAGFGHVVDAVRSAVQWFGEHKTISTVLFVVLGSVAAALGTVALAAGVAAVATGAFTAVMAGLTAVLFANPFVLVAAAIVGIGAALVIAYKRSETFRKVVGAAVDFVKKHWEEMLVVIGGPFGAVALIAIKHFDSIKAAASRVIAFITDHWKTLLVILTGPFGAAALVIAAHFETIKTAGRNLLQFLVGVFDKIAGGFSSMLSALSKVPGFGWAKKAAQDIDGVRAGLRKMSTALDELPAKKTLKLNLELTPGAVDALKALNKLGNTVGGPQGDGRIRRASGGMVPGYGNRDNVSAWLTPGEHVTRQVIVKRFGPTVFADINEGRLDPTVGYGEGERPSISTRPVRGNHYALGGAVAAQRAPVSEVPSVSVYAPIHAAASQNPDPVDASYKLQRLVERVGGGSPRQ